MFPIGNPALALAVGTASAHCGLQCESNIWGAKSYTLLLSTSSYTAISKAVTCKSYFLTLRQRVHLRGYKYLIYVCVCVCVCVCSTNCLICCWSVGCQPSVSRFKPPPPLPSLHGDGDPYCAAQGEVVSGGDAALAHRQAVVGGEAGLCHHRLCGRGELTGYTTSAVRRVLPRARTHTPTVSHTCTLSLSRAHSLSHSHSHSLTYTNTLTHKLNSLKLCVCLCQCVCLTLFSLQTDVDYVNSVVAGLEKE